MNFIQQMYQVTELETEHGPLLFTDTVHGQLFPRSTSLAKVMVYSARDITDVAGVDVARFTLLSPKSAFIPGNTLDRNDGVKLLSVTYGIIGVCPDGRTCKSQPYVHQFKRDTRLSRNWRIQPRTGRLFERRDLSELLDSTQFRGMMGIQFIS